MRWLLKRWWFWGGTGFMLVALVAGYFLIPISQGCISQANCDKIQLGMREGDVYMLLGLGDPDAEPVVRYEFLDIDLLVDVLPPRRDAVLWEDEDGNEIRVRLDDKGFVTAKRFVPSTTKPVFHERMKRRIERRIRAL
jgi:hypothetical protein